MLIGHKKQWEYLSRLASSLSLHHGYVFCGPAGIGKRTLAVELIKQIHGNDALVRANDNFKIIIPDGKEIKIAQIRELTSWLALKSPDKKTRIAIIDNAHLLNEEAQNSILKTLEEPKGNTTIILVTEFPKALLGTVLSRLLAIKFYPVSEEDMIEGLIRQGIKKIEAERIAAMSLGKPGLASRLVEHSSQLAEREQYIGLLEEALKSPLSRRIIMTKELGDDYAKVAEILTAWVWELRLRMIKSDNLVATKKTRKIIDRLEYTKNIITRTNANPTLAMESLMMAM